MAHLLGSMEFNKTLNKMTWNAKIDGSKGMRSPIALLHDDCMLEIFAHLCFSDRILVERVNKKWKRLSEKSWQRVTRFDLNKSTWGVLPTIRIIASSKLTAMKSLSDFQNESEDDDDDDSENDSVDSKDSDEYLQRIYDEMTSNGSQRTWTFFDNRVMKKVLNLCAGSLTHIVFGTDDEDYYSDRNGLNYKFPTKFMAECLESCHQVQKIKIPHDRDWKETFSLKSLRNLPLENLQELEIDASFRGKELVYLRKVLRYAVSLETLKLLNVDLKEEDFNLLPNKGALKTLKFRKEKELDAKKMVPILTELWNMEICEILVMNNMSDKLLKDLVDSCPELRSLVVMTAGDVTNSGLAYVGNLSKLEKLAVSHTSSITDGVIRHFLKLKTLKCIFCPSVRDPGILDLIKKSQCLERLVLDGTGVTMKGLKAIVEIMKQRKNRNLLIEVDGKKGIDEIGKLPENLKIGYYWG